MSRDNILDHLKITVLVEDYAGHGTGLLAQHGVSYLVEAEREKQTIRLLFDLGQNETPVISNAGVLGIDLQNIDLIMLSHCHYDHTGGLTGFLQDQQHKRIPIIAHPTLFRQTFCSDPVFRSIGTTPATNISNIENLGGDLILTTEPLAVFPGITSSGEIQDRVDFEKEPTLSAYTLDHGCVVPDRMADELALYFNTSAGLVVLTGCSHPGVISIVEKAKILTGINKVAAVIGGFHLASADKNRLAKTAGTLESEGCAVYTGHCTGLKAESALLETLGNKFHKLRTGLEIIIS